MWEDRCSRMTGRWPIRTTDWVILKIWPIIRIFTFVWWTKKTKKTIASLQAVPSSPRKTPALLFTSFPSFLRPIMEAMGTSEIAKRKALPHIILFFRSLRFLNLSSVPTNLSYQFSPPRHLNFVLFFLYYANSLADPILYALRLPELRRALLMCSRCRCQSVRSFPHDPWRVAADVRTWDFL